MTLLSLQDYLHIDSEKERSEEGVPPAYWPASGSVDLKDLTAVRLSPESQGSNC